MHMNPEQLSSNAKKVFKLIEFDENEELIAEIRKHPFGLFIIYFIGSFVALALFGAMLALIVISKADPLETGGVGLSSAQPIILLIGLVLIFITLVMTMIGAYLYKSDVVLVTSEKISQFLHRTIFDRKISQLSIGDVQDVTVSQNGLFARLFNFGTLVVETSGEQQNYTFNYTPDPYNRAKDIVGSHERNLVQYGN